MKSFFFSKFIILNKLLSTQTLYRTNLLKAMIIKIQIFNSLCFEVKRSTTFKYVRIVQRLVHRCAYYLLLVSCLTSYVN